jgi:MEMO1 family protein
MEYPKLRYIDTFPIEHQGTKMVCLRDPQKTDGKMLMVSPEALYIISYFNGENSILDIQTNIMRKYGSIIYKEQIVELVHQLDEALLLDSDKYKAYQKKTLEDFNSSKVRLSSHAGLSYPSRTEELDEWMRGYFNKLDDNNTDIEIKGLISPHIDFSRGGKSYARVYREILNNTECNIFIIFGTSHYADVGNPFILSRKNFCTPYGEVQPNNSVIDMIEKSCEWNIYEGEIFHRDEHSIEFQVVFLQYLLNTKKEFNIVPILCNSFYEFVRDGRSPIENTRVSKFLYTVKEIVNELGNNVVVIAGADLAHMGPKFGDEETVKETTLKWIKQRDQISINYTENLDAEGFYRSVEKEKDKRKICGLSPIYALLNTVNAKNGKMMDYGQALEHATGSVVTYASVAFY